MITRRDAYKYGRLTARPASPIAAAQAPETGLLSLGLSTGKQDYLYVPQRYTSSQPAALALLLHGAGATAAQSLALLRPYADTHNMLLLAPAAQDYTWDIIASDMFGPDTILLDQALAQVFSAYAIDPAHVAIGGFSDGASYALCIGLANGDLFSHLIAFSPGFAYALKKHGKPAVFVSHGAHDPVLPVAPCGRRVAAQLQAQGLPVAYAEFEGRHEVPPAIARQAVKWFVGAQK